MFVSMNFWIIVKFGILLLYYIILKSFMKFQNMDSLIIIVIFPNLVNMVDDSVENSLERGMRRGSRVVEQSQESNIFPALLCSSHPPITLPTKVDIIFANVYYKHTLTL